MKKAKRLLINTVILTCASLLMRSIGMWFSVYLSNKIGAQGIGLFELIMSVYTLAISFAASGVRLSSTRLVVDARSFGSHSDRQVMSLCIKYGCTLGAIAGALLFGFAGFISQVLLKSPPTAVCLKILAFGLPFLSVSSSLNGYFTAVRRAAHFAAAQIAEQLMRIGITIYCLGYMLPLGAEYACVALVIGSCCAEVLSTLISYCLFRYQTRGASQHTGGVSLLKKLISVAVPDAVGSWVRSSLVTAKNLLIPRGLRQTGASAQSALATYGTIHGMVLPILTFPAAFLSALSSLLVPEVAESRALGHSRHISYIVNRVIHITLLFSIAVCGILFCFSGPIGEAVYPGKGTSQFIRILAPVIPVMYLDMMVDGVLKGLGLQVASMRYNIIDAGMSLSLVWLLIPRYGILGYIITIYASEVLNFFLSISKLARVAGAKVQFFKGVLKPIASIAAAGMCAQAFLHFSSAATGTAGGALTLAIAASLLFYIVMLLLLGSITMQDIKWLARIIRRG